MTATATTVARATLEQFLALPEEQPAREYEDGEVTQKASPKARHSALQRALADLLDRPGRSPTRRAPSPSYAAPLPGDPTSPT
jgi:Uma2 family endonuclease